MYPFLRLYMAARAGRKAAPLSFFEAHVSEHRCLPWDIDPWHELNNGRTLTLYDIGRMGFAIRTGAAHALKERGYGVAVAGLTVRYRKRIQMFDRMTMVTKLIGWDTKFFYLEQSIWKGEECANHVLVRMAVISAEGRSGLIAPAQLLGQLGLSTESPPMEEWVRHWIASEAARPWPPQKG